MILPSLLVLFLKGSLVDLRLRASNDHCFTVGVPRAGRRPGCPSHLLPVGNYALVADTLQCVHAILGAPEFRDAAQADGLGQGHIRTVATNSEDTDFAVLTLLRIGDWGSGVRQRPRIREAACEDWQQHTDQEYSSVHNSPPYDASSLLGLRYGDRCHKQIKQIHISHSTLLAFRDKRDGDFEQ